MTVTDERVAQNHLTQRLVVRPEIGALIGAVQQQFRGYRFTLPGGVDEHHDHIRFSWALGEDAAAPAAIGTDVAEVGEDGRLVRVVGFIELMP